MPYLKKTLTAPTPQSEPLLGQEPNRGGGFAWKVDDHQQFKRFLILGSEGNQFYGDERELTLMNAQATRRYIQAHGLEAVQEIVAISDAGQAIKNEPALFALALCAASEYADVRREALEALPRVARTGTHLFQFVGFAMLCRKWGRGLRTAVGKWYTGKGVQNIAYQMLKYRQREGYTHRDLLRLAHPHTKEDARNALFKWAIAEYDPDTMPELLGNVPIAEGYRRIVKETDPARAAQLIRDYDLPREVVPTPMLKEKVVWDALLMKMPLTAMIRNLGNMSKCGLLVEGAWDAIERIVKPLGQAQEIRASRVHPVQILAALLTYEQGHSERGHGEWKPVPQIVDALRAAFELAFANVEPTGKKFVLGLDVSPSMWGANIANIPGLTAAIGAAAMAMITARTESRYLITAFTHELVEIPITATDSLSEVLNKVKKAGQRWGSTDCSLPMQTAIKNQWDVDLFAVYTDSETNFGPVHPAEALRTYRRAFNPAAKLATIAMQAYEFSIADPADPGMLDFVGFSTTTPQALAEFVKEGN